MIALQNAGVIVKNEATLVGLGNIKSFEVLLTVVGFFIIAALYIRKVGGALIIGILSVTIIAFIVGKVSYQGVFAMPPSLSPTFLQLELNAILDLALLPVIFAFLFVDLFDTSGTLIAVADKANLLNENNQLENLDKALLADSTATVVGSVFGTSSTTSYIESAAGVVSGGRTGQTAVTTAILFLLALFKSPINAMMVTLKIPIIKAPPTFLI
jgi:AGZA family xanthine/uracil permease-like MFS transporter